MTPKQRFKFDDKSNLIAVTLNDNSILELNQVELSNFAIELIKVFDRIDPEFPGYIRTYRFKIIKTTNSLKILLNDEKWFDIMNDEAKKLRDYLNNPTIVSYNNL